MFLKMKPICECGHIFKELVIDQEIYIDKLYGSSFITPSTVHPSICPQCGVIIEGVAMQYPINGRFEYDEKKYSL